MQARDCGRAVRHGRVLVDRSAQEGFRGARHEGGLPQVLTRRRPRVADLGEGGAVRLPRADRAVRSGQGVEQRDEVRGAEVRPVGLARNGLTPDVPTLLAHLVKPAMWGRGERRADDLRDGCTLLALEERADSLVLRGLHCFSPSVWVSGDVGGVRQAVSVLCDSLPTGGLAKCFMEECMSATY